LPRHNSLCDIQPSLRLCIVVPSVCQRDPMKSSLSVLSGLSLLLSFLLFSFFYLSPPNFLLFTKCVAPIFGGAFPKSSFISATLYHLLLLSPLPHPKRLGSPFIITIFSLFAPIFHTFFLFPPSFYYLFAIVVTSKYSLVIEGLYKLFDFFLISKYEMLKK